MPVGVRVGCGCGLVCVCVCVCAEREQEDKCVQNKDRNRVRVRWREEERPGRLPVDQKCLCTKCFSSVTLTQLLVVTDLIVNESSSFQPSSYSSIEG